MPECLDIDLSPADNLRLANLCGPLNEHLRQIESRLGVEINNRNHHFQLIGEPEGLQVVAEILKNLYRATEKEELSSSKINLFLQDSGVEQLTKKPAGC